MIDTDALRQCYCPDDSDEALCWEAADEIEKLRSGLSRLDSWDILTDEDRHGMIAEILDGSWAPKQHETKGENSSE